MIKDNTYFGICPSCGSIEWLELEEAMPLNENEEEKSKVNYLKSDGTIAHLNSYFRLKDKDYLDIICTGCECTIVAIPCNLCDIEERKKIWMMTPENRIKYSERFVTLDALDD